MSFVFVDGKTSGANASFGNTAYSERSGAVPDDDDEDCFWNDDDDVTDESSSPSITIGNEAGSSRTSVTQLCVDDTYVADICVSSELDKRSMMLSSRDVCDDVSVASGEQPQKMKDRDVVCSPPEFKQCNYYVEVTGYVSLICGMQIHTLVDSDVTMNNDTATCAQTELRNYSISFAF